MGGGEESEGEWDRYRERKRESERDKFIFQCVDKRQEDLLKSEKIIFHNIRTLIFFNLLVVVSMCTSHPDEGRSAEICWQRTDKYIKLIG